MTGRAVRFAGYGERVDEGLRMLLPDVNKQLLNKAVHILPWCVNTGDQLGNHLEEEDAMNLLHITMVSLTNSNAIDAEVFSKRF